MNLALNGLFLSRPHSGTGQYLHGLLGALANLPDLKITVLVPEAHEASVPDNVELRVVAPTLGRLGWSAALHVWETRDVARAVAGLGVDLYHTPYPTPPVKPGVPVVMTVHDLIPWQFPIYRRGLARRLKQRRILAGINRADQLIAVSEQARQEIISLTHLDPRRVELTYEGIDPFFTETVPDADITAARDRFNLTKPYLAYVGGFDYRKNVRLLPAAMVASGLAGTHELVVMGQPAKPGDPLQADYRNLKQLAAEAGASESLRLTGFVSATDKRALLKGAAGFIYPSLAEGFGIPVGEALAVGTPVAASDIPVHREIWEGAFTAFDPEQADAAGRALEQIIKHPPDPAAGRERVARYDWPTAAAKTAEAYAAVLKNA
jgi:glycosyltransferase involved in cell wall biosynthesis